MALDNIRKLFGKAAQASDPPPAGRPPSADQPPFLCREAVFNRADRLSAHLFRLQPIRTASGLPVGRQGELDRILIDTLNEGTPTWNQVPVLIPLSSASLALPTLADLPAGKITLLLQLAADAEVLSLAQRIGELRQCGFSFGLFRQPDNPAFGALMPQMQYAVINVGNSEAEAVRNFSIAIRALNGRPTLLALNVDTPDEYRFCQQCGFDAFQGRFAEHAPAAQEVGSDPHKSLLLRLLHLVQSDASTAEIAHAVKQDPLLSFRILRYMNTPALGLSRPIDSLEQALLILGRQRFARWLGILLFSVRHPQIGDWLLVEQALTRGRLMEILGNGHLPGAPPDLLFLTGIFSCLERLLRRPLAQALGDMPLPTEVGQALFEDAGPYAPLLRLAQGCDAPTSDALAPLAEAAGVDAASLNRALLDATAWATEVTADWA